MPSKTLSHGELCGENSESVGTDLQREFRNGCKYREEGSFTHEELFPCLVEVEYAAVASRQENDLRAAQRHRFCFCRLVRARVDAW